MNTIGIFPGRFQPPHRGHLKVYNYVQKLVGPNNAYIATSDKTDPIKSPLNFSEKQQVWTRHGVSIDKIVKVTNPYKSEEITHKFDPKQTSAIFFLSQKDAQRIPFVRKDGQPAYFQPYKGNENNLLPIEQHSYIAITPTFDIEGKKISGTTVREGLGSVKYNESQKKKFFQWVFGWFDIALFELLVRKFTESQQSVEPQNVKQTKPIKELKEIIKGMIKELVFPEPSDDSADDGSKVNTVVNKEDEAEKEKEDKLLARKELDAARKRKEFQLMQKKYREKGIQQDRRDIKATDSEISSLHSKM